MTNVIGEEVMTSEARLCARCGEAPQETGSYCMPCKGKLTAKYQRRRRQREIVQANANAYRKGLTALLTRLEGADEPIAREALVDYARSQVDELFELMDEALRIK